MLLLGNNVFAFRGIYLFVSTDLGETWEKKNLPFGVNLMYDLTGNNGNIYFTPDTYDCIYFSSNMGDDWKKIKIDNLIRNIGAYSFKGDTIVAVGNKTIYGSTDFGKSWQAMDLGLSNGYIRLLVAEGNDVYTGTEARGIFKTKISDFGFIDVNESNMNDLSIDIYPIPSRDFYSN